MTNLNLHPPHSPLNFSIQHLLVSNLKPPFNQFHPNISPHFNDLTSLQPTFTLKPNSIHTKVPHPHNHLKTPHFLHPQNYPQIKFQITNLHHKSLTPNLTIK
ncbi:YceI family protein, partial [Staphylococcus haemolyticus]|uniref:YceI family protein n=1 Tax=Staphylococcus haemolyticus TaxID=1283 RepID=UPI001642B333